MSQLFSPFQIGGLTLANRIIIAPMCQYSADEGRTTDWHTIHLGNLSHSGAALLIIGLNAWLVAQALASANAGVWDVPVGLITLLCSALLVWVTIVPLRDMPQCSPANTERFII